MQETMFKTWNIPLEYTNTNSMLPKSVKYIATDIFFNPYQRSMTSGSIISRELNNRMKESDLTCGFELGYKLEVK